MCDIHGNLYNKCLDLYTGDLSGGDPFRFSHQVPLLFAEGSKVTIQKFREVSMILYVSQISTFHG